MEAGTPEFIQSVMKPLSLLLAPAGQRPGDGVAHVGVEATGKPFDAINVADNAPWPST